MHFSKYIVFFLITWVRLQNNSKFIMLGIAMFMRSSEVTIVTNTASQFMATLGDTWVLHHFSTTVNSLEGENFQGNMGMTH